MTSNSSRIIWNDLGGDCAHHKLISDLHHHKLDTPNLTNKLVEELLVISQKGSIVFICFLGKGTYFLSGGQTIDYKLKMSFKQITLKTFEKKNCVSFEEQWEHWRFLKDCFQILTTQASYESCLENTCPLATLTKKKEL